MKKQLYTIACKYSDEKTIRLLLDKNADVNSTDIENKTPLHYATQCFRNNVLKVLVEYNANVNARDVYNETPLYYAFNDPVIIDTLIYNHADPNVTNIDNETPLELCLRVNMYSSKRIVYHIILQALVNNNLKNNTTFIKNMTTIDDNEELKQFKSLCDNDINKMKSIKFNNIYGLDVFIRCRDKIDLLSKLVINIKDEYLSESMFPIYYEELIKSVNIAKQRHSLLKSSVKEIDSISIDSKWSLLPLEIRYTIISLLDNNDVKIISKSV